MNKQDELIMDLDLISIQNIINEIGLKAALLEKSDLIRLSTLGLTIDPDDSERERSIFMNFVPLPDGVFEDVKLLQFYSELPFKCSEKSRKGVESLFNFINLHSPIGTFGLKDDSKISFKHVHTLNKFENLSNNGPLLIDLLKFLIFTLDTYSDSIELVAGGIKDSEEVLKELKAML